MNATAWLDQVAAIKFEAAFNPYADFCATYDLEDAPTRRRAALQACLDCAAATELDSIWIARDLGHRGGRRTGLALTDDVHLSDHAARWALDFERPTKGSPVAEATASVIWRSLRRVQRPVFLWNVFPLHPHEPGQPFSNRQHTAAERDFGLSALESLLALLRPRRVIAIGGDAYRACDRLGVQSAQVRHPSYGGARVFTYQVEQIYDLSATAEQPRLI